MAAIPYTKKMLIQRIKRHMANGFPNSDFATSDNETLLYIDTALAFQMVGKAYEGAKIEGSLVMPEAFLITYDIGNLSKDTVTNNWFGTLPHPPISLPLGYSINRVYTAQAGQSTARDFLPLKAKRIGYRNNMPKPPGAFYWVEADKLWASATNGASLNMMPMYVQMASPRTQDVDDVMNVPEDVVQAIFDTVVKQMMQRYGMPQDVIKDNLPAGNKSS